MKPILTLSFLLGLSSGCLYLMGKSSTGVAFVATCGTALFGALAVVQVDRMFLRRK